MAFRCTTWADTAGSKIAAAMTALNAQYLSTNLRFKAYIQYLPCNGTSGTKHYRTCDDNLVITAVLTERGANWRSAGGFVLVAGEHISNSFNGFMYYPRKSSSYAGIGFMANEVIGAGFTTLGHDLDHGFGLHHVFKGVSETTSCLCSEANATDIHGDFCSDKVQHSFMLHYIVFRACLGSEIVIDTHFKWLKGLGEWNLTFLAYRFVKTKSNHRDYSLTDVRWADLIEWISLLEYYEPLDWFLEEDEWIGQYACPHLGLESKQYKKCLEVHLGVLYTQYCRHQ